jgi:CBS domain containing-hemolysin-like protein
MPFLKRWKNILPLIFKKNQNSQDSHDSVTLETILTEPTLLTRPLESEERLLVENALTLKEMHVTEIMIPRADIVWIDADFTYEEVLEKIRISPHSRFPVCREELDHSLGMISVKEILIRNTIPESFNLKEHLRQPLFIAPSMRCLDLLLRMKHSRMHMALIMDEFGSIDGLVTLTDIIENIVGEMNEDIDPETTQFVQLDATTLLADGRAFIEEFEKKYGKISTSQEPQTDIETLAGLVFSLCGRVPHGGEKIKHPSGLVFEVIEADPRRVKRLKIHHLNKLLPLDHE